MKELKYIFINNDGTFGFKDKEINTILETDILISDDIYNKFFEMQSQGKYFRIKNLQGITFEEIFEEVIPEPILPAEPSEIDKLKTENESMKQSIAELTMLVTGLMGGGV